eukprot:TRINITY_DN8528_c0_g1_i1.p1 TRINITY_DN8528_c0_g1~~TRINITY_DN8528_c0_g1_i1.p1  ORF type:complete len:492 (+),score=138.96 TRINITY_DN8528_c0_g1_i1:40-1476(+)
MSEGPTVCVIGAGFAGICAAKTLRADGFKVTIVEAAGFYGGIWHPQGGAYIHVKGNNRVPTFEYSDVNYPPKTSQPDGITIAQQDVWEYIQKYVKTHQLEGLMQLNSKVVSVKRKETPSGGWSVVVLDTLTREKTTSYAFDFVVVCTGLFQVPRVPGWPGMNEFTAVGGKVYHSSDIQAEEMLRNKKVLVVGGSKSAFDMINLAVTLNSGEQGIKPTIVAKTFYLQATFEGKVPVENILWTKWYAATKPWPHTLNFGHWFFTRTQWGNNIVKSNQKKGEAAIRRIQKIRKEDNNPMYPADPFPEYSGYTGVDRGTYQMALDGRLNAKQGVTIEKMDSNGFVHFSDGTSEKFDVIVAATGFKQQFPFFTPEDAARYGVVHEEQDEDFDGKSSSSRHVWKLYRGILPVEEPTLGFIGFVLLIDNSIAMEVGAHWLSDVFSHRIKLPPKQVMRQRIEDVISVLTHAVKPMGTLEFQYLKTS